MSGREEALQQDPDMGLGCADQLANINQIQLRSSRESEREPNTWVP